MYSMQGNPRQSWVLDSTLWITDSRYWIPVFVSRTWILDSNLSGIPDSLRCIPDSKPRIPDSTSKLFPDSGISGFPYTVRQVYEW